MRVSAPTVALGSVLALAALVLCVAHALPGPQRLLMERQHLRAPSFAAWAAAQPLPSMYTFAHQAWTSDSLVAWAAVEEGRAGWMGYVNHYPTRRVTFGWDRQRFAGRGQPTYFYAQTTGRGLVVRSVYRVEPAGGGRLRFALVDGGARRP